MSSKLTGGGIFSSADAFMADFLSRMGADKNDESAFVARNFLLDENVSAERFDSYQAEGAVGDHGDKGTWKATHNAYLSKQIWIPGAGTRTHTHIDPDDDANCPETFRCDPSSSPFALADHRLDLLHMVEVDFIARRAKSDVASIITLAQRKMENTASRDELDTLDRTLADWLLETDHRPVFAAFWEDLRDLFGDAPARDDSAWADKMRNRLGLSHFDPGARKGPIAVLVFRYPVGLIPHLKKRRDLRPLVPPTVLDGSHSPPFCPAPRGDANVGHTVDLDANSDLPRREVLHPKVKFESKHVFRVGTIRSAIAPRTLEAARWMHLEQVRTVCDRLDYATGTDGDLG